MTCNLSSFHMPLPEEKSVMTSHPLTPYLETGLIDYNETFNSIKNCVTDTQHITISFTGSVKNLEEFETMTKLLYDILPMSNKEINLLNIQDLDLDVIKYICHSYNIVTFQLEGTEETQNILSPDSFENILDKIEFMAGYPTNITAVKSITTHNVNNLAADILFLVDNGLPFIPYIDLTSSNILISSDREEVEHAKFLQTFILQIEILKGYSVNITKQLIEQFTEQSPIARTQVLCTKNGFSTFTFPSKEVISYDMVSRLRLNTALALAEVMDDYDLEKRKLLKNRFSRTDSFDKPLIYTNINNKLYSAMSVILRSI